MTSKEAAIDDLIRRLADDASLDDIMEELYVRRSIEERLCDLDENGGVSHEQVRQRLSKWVE